MSNFLKTLIPLLSSIAIVLALAAPPARGVDETTSFTYDFSGWAPPPTDLSLQGDAHFAPDTTFLRLTKTDPSGNALQFSVGRAVRTTPIQLWDEPSGAQADFETTVKFIIRPNPGDADPGNGLGFYIAPPRHLTGRKNYSVLVAEFDIYSDPGADPDYRHIGIDIGSKVSRNTTEVGDEFLLGQEVTAFVSYKQETKLIEVTASAGGKSFEVSYVFDLSTVLPQQVQVGISAATGTSVAVHELISWYFTSTTVQEGGARQYV